MTVVFATFIVEDLEVYFVAALLDAPADGVVGRKAVAVVLGAERFVQDDVVVAVVG